MKKLKVLSLVEGNVVTAPAKIVLSFASDCRELLDLTLVSFLRRRSPRSGAVVSSPLQVAAEASAIPVATIHESGRYDVRAIPQLKRVIDEHRPDIVQTNSVKSHFLVSLLRNRQFGWVAFHHGYTAEDLKMRIYNQLDRISLRVCDQVVTVCHAFSEQLQSMGVQRDQIRIIPNGLPSDFLTFDQAKADDSRQRLGIGSGEFVVLSVGRLSPEKGHRYLIDAAAKLVRSGRDLKMKVIIAGAGLLERSLTEQISAAGLEDTVKLIGHQSDVKPLFMIADVFVLPSLSEGSPMVLLESMAAKVPVIATSVGGIPEAVSDGDSALLIPPADGQAISNAILSLSSDQERSRRMTAAASARLRDSFSPELYNSRVVEVFDSVSAAKRSLVPQRVQVEQ